MTVLPYVAISLISAMARLSPGEGRRLARVVIMPLLLLGSIGLITPAGMAFSYPAWEAGSFFSVSMVETPESSNWLELFIKDDSDEKPRWCILRDVLGWVK